MNYHTLGRAIGSMLLIVCLWSNSSAQSRCVPIISPTATCGSSFIEDQTSGQKRYSTEKKKEIESRASFSNTTTVEKISLADFFPVLLLPNTLLIQL